MTASELLGFKDFAERIGCRPSYVTQLRKEGRLVLTDDGKQVRVAESIARIEATRSPSHDGVAARHAAARQTATPTPPGPEAPPPAYAAADPGADKIGNSYQAARAVKERYMAMSAKRDYEVAIGKLLDAAEVRSALISAITVLRNDLESLPENIAPALAAESDENRMRILLAEEIEHVLANLATRFDQMGAGHHA
jgi:hypothetical protein